MELLSPPRKSPFTGDYWFIHGTDKKNQFILAFGTARRSIHVNGYSVKTPNFGVVFWGYVGEEKIVKFDKSFPLDFPPKEPFYFDKTKSGYKLECDDTKLFFRNKYVPTLDDKVITSRIHNEYRNVSGKIFGKKFNGKSYVQKVEVNTPLKTWDWLRFHGNNVGTLFRYKGKKAKLYFNKKEYVVNVKASDGHQLLTSDKVNLEATPYAMHRILIRGITTFQYDEYFAKISGTIDKKKVDEFGMTEDAKGIVF